MDGRGLTGDLAAEPEQPQAEPETSPGTESQITSAVPLEEQPAELEALPAVPELLEVEPKAINEPATVPEVLATLVPEVPRATISEELAAVAEATAATEPETPRVAVSKLRTAAVSEKHDADPETPHPAFKEMGDRLLEWLLPILAIVLPATFLILIPFVQKNIVTWSNVSLSAKRGDYLIPVLILCAETVRRWCREVSCRGRILQVVRFVAVSMCTVALLISFASSVALTEFTLTPASGRSIVTITAWCLIPSFVFGTIAVVLPPKERAK